MTDQEAHQRSARQWTYFTLALVALALTAGRISVVTGRDGTTAFLSANDRSRWCTVASLVEHGTYAIDTQIEIVDPIRRHIHPWQTIDKVRHLGTDDKQHYYSSKPPLFPTAVAGVYKIVHLATGMTLTQQPIYLARIMLALVNLPLLAMFFPGNTGLYRTSRQRRLVQTYRCTGMLFRHHVAAVFYFAQQPLASGDGYGFGGVALPRHLLQ